MDIANYALASFLARRPAADVHLVAHSVAPDLGSARSVRVHAVPRPFRSHRIGQPLLSAAAHRVRRGLGQARSIANGGNADLADVNWVHYLHAACRPVTARRAALTRLGHLRDVRDEAASLGRAGTVICNSRTTAQQVASLSGGRASIHVVYYGIDPVRFDRAGAEERDRSRRALGLDPHRFVVIFIGALGDRRKNFDTVFEAWRQLSRSRDWEADLLVAGVGAELPSWTARAAALPGARIRFLGYYCEVPGLLAAGDVLVHPARYEPYGLAVHEAICRGIPALVSRRAGVAERYPDALRTLLLEDPESATDLAARLRHLRSHGVAAGALTHFGAALRSRTWDDMARDIVGVIGEP